VERGNGRSRALALAQNAPAAAAGCCRVSQRQVFPARAGLAGSSAACSERTSAFESGLAKGLQSVVLSSAPRTHGRRPPDDRPMSPNGLGGTNIAQMERSSRATILRQAGHAVKQRDPYVARGPVRGSRSVLTRHRMGGVPDQRDPVTRRAWAGARRARSGVRPVERQLREQGTERLGPRGHATGWKQRWRCGVSPPQLWREVDLSLLERLGRLTRPRRRDHAVGDRRGLRACGTHPRVEASGIAL
jgi:hypothetical protein